MTAACRESCCSVVPRLTVDELFARGFRRNREAPRSVEGAPCKDAAGNLARFSLDVEAGKVVRVGFRVSTCATLIAYSELLAEMLPGARIELARKMSPESLVAVLPGVPPLKRDRAGLAIAAFRAALAEVKDCT